MKRFGYTNVTSWWSDGSPGPLVYIFPEGKFFSNKKMASLNKKYNGEVFLMSSGKENNHFADSENNVEMWEECYGAACARRRHELGLDNSHRGCLLYDAWTGFEAMCGSVRRQLFVDRCNITTIQGEGKWSVHGSPADANHAYFRKLNDVMEELCFGFHADPWKRKRLEDLACDLTGLAPRDHTDPEAGS